MCIHCSSLFTRQPLKVVPVLFTHGIRLCMQVGEQWEPISFLLFNCLAFKLCLYLYICFLTCYCLLHLYKTYIVYSESLLSFIIIIYYRNKRHIRVLYDGFKLSSGCIKATKPEGYTNILVKISSKSYAKFKRNPAPCWLFH